MRSDSFNQMQVHVCNHLSEDPSLLAPHKFIDLYRAVDCYSSSIRVFHITAVYDNVGQSPPLLPLFQTQVVDAWYML